MENECEALPGVAYPGVRDNRITLNTKTGYDDDDDDDRGSEEFGAFFSSDHNMIDLELVVTTGGFGFDTAIYKYDFKQGNYKAVKNILSEVNWSEIFR